MKPLRIIPLILFAACGGHQPAEQKKDTIADTIQAGKRVVADTPAAAPVTVGKDTAVNLPGKTIPFIVDLNYDGVPDTISLRMLTKYKTDTLYYDRVTVSIAQRGKWSFTSASNWDRVDDDFDGAGENAYPTNHFFLAKNGMETLLVLFGPVDEVQRYEFSIIRIKDNMPKLVFDENHWEDNNIEVVNFIKDMDGDGKFEFGYSHMTDGVNAPDGSDGIITNYSPTMVYTVDDSLILNKPVMKKYNEKYYVFAGYEYSSIIQVFHPSDRSKSLSVYKR